MLSYDGTKIFTAGKSRNGRFNQRGRGNRNGQNGNRRDNQDGKPNRKNGNGKSGNKGSSVRIHFFYINPVLNLFSKSSGNNQHWCKFHGSRGTHTQSDCFLNKDSKLYKGDAYVKEWESKNGNKRNDQT